MENKIESIKLEDEIIDNPDEINAPAESKKKSRGDYDKLSKDEKIKLRDQVNAEYKYSWDSVYPKIQKWLVRLKLYNNQKRDESAVGDLTMFTVHQTVLAALYIDGMKVKFAGRQDGDNDATDNLNDVAVFDNDEMKKDEIDYFWDWDTTFFSRGFVDVSEFHPKKLCPVPRVIDPCTFLPDPDASSIHGIGLGKTNESKFYGYLIKNTKYQMEKYDFFNVDLVKEGTEVNNLVEQAKEARAEAAGLNSQKTVKYNLGYNNAYPLLKWFTVFKVGNEFKKVECVFANDRRICVKFKIIGDVDADWKLIDRPLYPTSHEFYGTSVPDLTEDKQRARAVIQNLGIQSLKGDLYPMYIYNDVLIRNKGDLNFEFNKFVPVEGSVRDAIAPINKANPNLGFVNFILDTLDVSAQRATATPEMQQGVLSDQKRTLGELNKVSSGVANRNNLASRIFYWSEKRFWENWFKGYKDYFDEDIHEKVIRITGAYGYSYRPITKDKIMPLSDQDPDVIIESVEMNRIKQMEDRALFINYLRLLVTAPEVNIREALRKAGQLHGVKKEELQRLLPLTIDEMIAEKENQALSEGKMVPVKAEDDHRIHLDIHFKARDTDATYAHIETHKEALRLQKAKPQLFPNLPQNQPTNGGQGTPTDQKVLNLVSATQTNSKVTPPSM